MTPTQYRDACKALGISIYASAKVLSISQPTAWGYASGNRPISERSAKLLRALVFIKKLTGCDIDEYVLSHIED